VAGYSGVVIDTHPLIFHAAGSKILGRRAAAHIRACENKQAITYVPVAVVWEFALLVRIRRIHIDGSLREFFGALFSNPAYQPVDLTAEHVYLADEIRPNNDPFDALICATAISMELPLITRDQEIEQSGIVETVWD
jgi:PIN domain nuclease of toxin-antitoxin system